MYSIICTISRAGCQLQPQGVYALILLAQNLPICTGSCVEKQTPVPDVLVHLWRAIDL